MNLLWLLACGGTPSTPVPSTWASTTARPAPPPAECWTPLDPPQTGLPSVGITSWPIRYGAKRERLTSAYLALHRGEAAVSGEPSRDAWMTPRMIVLHWTASGSARSTWYTFEPERRPRRPDLSDARALNVSTHYLVDRDGTIYELMHPERVGRHVIGLNHLAIGVENVGDGRRYPLTDAQVASNVALVRSLASTYPSITHLIGHYEYRAFEEAAHPYFEDREPGRTHKVDPGAAFLGAVRRQVEDLHLAGPPDPTMCESNPDADADADADAEDGTPAR